MNDESKTPATAGWYAAESAGHERYWDGTAWTAATRVAPGLGEVAAGNETPQRRRAWFRRKRVLIPAAVLGGALLIGGFSSAMGGGSAEPEVTASPSAEEVAAAEVPETTGLTAREAQALIENAGLEVDLATESGVVLDRDNWIVVSTVPAAGETLDAGGTVVVNVERIEDDADDASSAPTSEAPATEQPAQPSMTVAQENAVGSAQSYLEFAAFSRAGLLQQLTSQYGEGYVAADAEFAISYLEQNGLVDWNAEAVESAQSYLSYSNFSRQGLYDQLTSQYGESFTPDQANYALSQVGL